MQEMDDHETEKLASSRPFDCKLCSKTFKHKCDLERHTKTHYGIRPHNCLDCKKTFSSRSDLNRHRRIHTGYRPFKCHIQNCAKAFPQRTDLSRHIRTHTGVRPFVCTKCPQKKAFCQKSDLVRHYRLHSGERPFKCNQCSKSYSQKSDLDKHSKTHRNLNNSTKSQNMDEPEKNQPNQSETSSNATVVNTRSIPQVLGPRIIIASNNPVHNSQIFHSAPTFMDPYTGQLFTINFLSAQNQVPVVTAPEIDKDTDEETDNNFEMTAGENFTTNEASIQNTGQKGFSRDEVLRGIMQQQERQRLLYEKLKEKQHPEKMARQNERLEDQQLQNSEEIMRIQHQIQFFQSGEKTTMSQEPSPQSAFNIEAMTKMMEKAVSTSTSSTLISTLKSALNADLTPLPASEISDYATEVICIPSSSTPYTPQESSSDHTLSCASSPSPPPPPTLTPAPRLATSNIHKCHHCLKVFAQKSDLHRHIKIHTGVKPFRCTQCPKAFYQRSDLSRHSRTHTGDRPFKCGRCDKAFAQKSDLHRHERRVHDGAMD